MVFALTYVQKVKNLGFHFETSLMCLRNVRLQRFSLRSSINYFWAFIRNYERNASLIQYSGTPSIYH